MPGAELTRVFHPRAGLVAGEQIDLQLVGRPVMTECAGGGKTVSEKPAHAARATVTKVLVAFRVTDALVDRTHVVPDTQHVVFGAPLQEPPQLHVSKFGGAFGTTVFALVEVHGDEQPAATGRPLQRGLDTTADRRVDVPGLQRCGRLQRLQGHAQPARIVHRCAVRAKGKHRQRPWRGERAAGIGQVVGNPWRGAQERGNQRVFTA